MKLINYLILFFTFNLVQSQELYKTHYDSGELKTEGQIVNNKREGQWKNYYKNGEVKMLYSYTEGKFDIVKTTFFKDGTVKQKTTKENDEYIIKLYKENGSLFVECLHKNGYYKEFFENGSLKIKSNYKDWELNGEWKEYYEDGNLKWTVMYKDGYRDGLYQLKYSNGTINVSGTMREGKKNGIEKQFDSSNNLMFKVNYLNNELEQSRNENNKFNEILVPDGVLEIGPIYPGCEKKLNNRTKRNCMSEKVSKFVNRKFNTELADDMGLSGVQRIYINYTVSKTGEIINIRIKSPIPALRTEAKRVIKLLPQMLPGIQRGKKVDVTFSLPIAFRIAD